MEFPPHLTLRLRSITVTEAIKYCKLDCESLHQIIMKFNDLFYAKFQINVHKSLTGPSLTMRMFKSHYMPENTIYQLLGYVEQDIRQSYSGGAVHLTLRLRSITVRCIQTS